MPTELESKRAAVDAARAALTVAAQALERARRIETTAAETVRTLEQRAAQAEAAQAAQLAEAIAAGGPNADLSSAVDDNLASALASARFDLSVKSKARASLEGAHAAAQADLVAAEAAVIAAVDKIFADESIEQARQLSHCLDEAQRLGKALLFLSIADEMNGLRTQPPKVTEILGRLDLPLLDRREVATNFLRFGDTDAAARRNARRAAMIRGDVDEEEQSAA
jgi:hypothetical protein